MHAAVLLHRYLAGVLIRFGILFDIFALRHAMGPQKGQPASTQPAPMEPSPGPLKKGRHYLKADEDDEAPVSERGAPREEDCVLRGRESLKVTGEQSPQLLLTKGRHYLKAEED
jgi:hypothetical protein